MAEDIVKFDFLGLFEMTLENSKMFLNLANAETWKKHISDININIGKEVSIIVDKILGADESNLASYKVSSEDATVVIVKGSREDVKKKNQQWWFNPKDGEGSPDMAFVLSATSDQLVQVGSVLRAKYPYGMVPINKFAEELWWFKSEQESKYEDVENSNMQLQKIIDNIVVSNYNTLVGRVINEPVSV